MKRIRAKTFYAIVVIVISAVVFSSASFAEIRKPSSKSILSTSITFVTDRPERFNMLDRLEMISQEISLLGEHACSSVGFRQMPSRLSSYDVMNSDHLDLATGESILCDYELLDMTSVVESLQTHVSRGKRVILYGEDIDLELFCTLFNLTDSLPSEHDKKELADLMVDDPSPSSQLVAVGVESADWGNTLIIVHDISYDHIRAIDLSIANAIHAKKVSINKPYNHSSESEGEKDKPSTLLSGEAAVASGYDNYPIINSQRNTASGIGFYTLITDGYLHRIPDDDSEYDYFILETISELIHVHPALDKSSLRTRLTAVYTTDKVRSGGPAAQGPTTNQKISVQFAPPSISYSFTTNNNSRIYTAFSISNRYFQTTYVDHEYPPLIGFLGTSHFTTSLSYATYAPSSSYTYTKVNIVQRLGSGLFWDNYFNPWPFYYNY